MIRLLLFVLRISPKTFGKPIVLYHSELTVLHCLSGTVGNETSFAQETGQHMLRSAYSTNNSRWIWLVFEDPHDGQLFSVGLIRTNSWFFNCDNLINVFWGSAIVFFQHFNTPIDTKLFWAFVKLCGIQREQVFFTARSSCNIECINNIILAQTPENRVRPRTYSQLWSA